MTERELYIEIKRIFAVSCAQEMFSFRDLWTALCEKNGIATEAHILSPHAPQPLAGAAVEDAGRLCDGYPLQYYLGSAYFCCRRFAVRENVLIPREDTAVVCRLAERYASGAALFDFCTGSGIIPITVLADLPDTRAQAVDISPDAVALTLENARLHGVNGRLSCSVCDLFSDRAEALLNEFSPAVITANPPYIRTKDMQKLPKNVKREPSLALDGGEDGMRFYRRITRLCAPLVRRGSRLVFEIGFDQDRDIAAVAKQYGFGCTVFPDGAGLPRAALIEKNC